MPRLACAALLLAFAIAGCGGGTKTVTETQTTATAGTTTEATTGASTETNTTPQPAPIPAGDHGPHYFETPSHNIGCYLDRQSARCDIRERTWSPPPEPAYCKKAGVDFGQGLSVATHRATVVCAGDTTLGAGDALDYGRSIGAGLLICESEESGMTCRDTETGRGFTISKQAYEIF